MPSGFFMKDSMTGAISLLADSSVDNAIQALEDFAPEIQAYAQDNAPWNDITGDARSGLVTEVSEDGGTIYLELAHTAEHGQWLEVIQSGRFAIIMPTLEYFAGQVFSEAGASFFGEGE